MIKKKQTLLFACLLVSILNFAQNPIIKNKGISDPHIRVFNDTIYLYSGHDSSPSDKLWVMKDWYITSTTDLVNWTVRDTISPKDNYMDNNSEDCWAGDAATRNGHYYFYFSDRNRSTGVMTSKTPIGPFSDALEKPLVVGHDPTIFTNDDANKTPYIVWGCKKIGGYHIAKLNEDMISLAEEPRLIKINGEQWDKTPGWMNKNYIFKHKDTYYLSWGRDYAVSKNLYGPYECAGSVGNGYKLSPVAHGSFFNWKGQFYHVWCYYIKPGFKYRETIISYCHMGDDGKIVTDTKFLDSHFSNGVGQYNASWDKIEAEWFYEVSGKIEKQGNQKTGFTLANIKNEDWIRFANVTFDEVYKKCIASVLLKGEKGTLEIRSDSPTGKVLGALELSSSKNFQVFSIPINTDKGKKDIYLIFKGSKESSLEVDWFKFE